MSTTNSPVTIPLPATVFVPGTSSSIAASHDPPANDTSSDVPLETLDGPVPSHAVCSPETSCVFGTEFARVTMREAIELADQIIHAGKPEYFVTANLNYLMLSESSKRVRQINRQAAAVIADGNPVVLRSRFGINPLPERVAGSDMIVELGKLSAARGYRIFLLGGAPGVADMAATNLRKLCPNVQIAGCLSPPFRPLSEQEHAQLLEQIRAARPQILLVAFGQPKGEIWIDENREKLGIPLSIQLGASFDFLAGTALRAPAFWQSIGCEWLYRALKEPRRLGPRYAKNIWFLAKLLFKDLVGLLR